MSYDLMVFDPDMGPTNAVDFDRWYKQQTEWSEDHDYQDLGVCTPQLRSWFLDMIADFPAMNGPHASEGSEDDPRLTDYSIGRSIIYASFSWSRSREAYERVHELAGRHRVGLYNPNTTLEEIWVPTDAGKLTRLVAEQAAGSVKVFYQCQSTGEDIPSAEAVWIDRGEALRLARRILREAKDFIGFVDEHDGCLQFMFEGGDKVWIEVPVPEDKGSYGKFISRTEADILFEALPESFTRDCIPGHEFSPWFKPGQK